MMIERYALVDIDGERDDTVWYEDCQRAIAEAGSTHAVEALQFRFSDSDLVYTPDGSQTWPPSTVYELRHANGGAVVETYTDEEAALVALEALPDMRYEVVPRVREQNET